MAVQSNTSMCQCTCQPLAQADTDKDQDNRVALIQLASSSMVLLIKVRTAKAGCVAQLLNWVKCTAISGQCCALDVRAGPCFQTTGLDYMPDALEAFLR